MKFTNYIVTETTGNSVDPLGYLRPTSEISGALFRQFTVLSNHPAYQGFLAFAFAYLAGQSITPAKREFSRRVRDLEILWGVLNVKAGKSVVNVTKFEPLAGEGSLRLTDARHRPALYARLNYGVLGHYASPSVFWKILESGASGLTALGAELADAWRFRAGYDFAVLADRWLNDADLFATDGLDKWISAYQLSANPELEEQKVWKSLIENLCVKDPVIAPLWRKPLPQDILSLSTAEDRYPGFFPALRNHYAGHDELCRRIDLCNRFERLSGLVQFVFEWQYVSRLDEIRVIGLSHGDLPVVVTHEIAEAAKQFIAGQGDRECWSLPAALADLRDHESIVAVVLSHHTRHQRSKGASPFIAGDAVAVQDRVQAQEFVHFFNAMVGDPGRLADAAQWRYHRNWHFWRAHEWQRYAGVN